jgi:hypothetical protein
MSTQTSLTMRRTVARKAARPRARVASVARVLRPAAPAPSAFATPAAELDARAVLQLQRSYGNRRTAQMLAASRAEREPSSPPLARAIQRAVIADAGVVAVQRDCPASAQSPPPLPPARDPKFNAAAGKVRQTAEREKRHSSPATRAAATQAAAVAPANDLASQAKAAQVGKMSEQQPGAFDRAKFIADVRKAIAAAAPANIDEAEKYESSGKANQGKEQMSGLVRSNKESAEHDIRHAADEAPDASKARPKPVAPVPQEPAGPPPAPVDAASAMPAPKPAAEFDLRHDQCAAEGRMEDAKVTESQLAKSNEPQFKGALDSKRAADAHTAAAPAAYRAGEQKVLGDARAQANASAATGLAAMHTGRTGALNKAAAHQAAGKAADEAKRAKVAAGLEAIYAKAKQDVATILDGIEGRINPVFEAGEQAARAEMARSIATETKAFHDSRGLLDKLGDLFSKPPELDAIVDRAVKVFLQRMDAVIGRVADIVGTELARAKARIAAGQKEVAQHVAQLPRDLKQIGRDLLSGFADKFAALSGEVDARRDAIVDGVAKKYVAARDAANERAKELKDANKGLWDKAKDAIGDTIETILKLKDMLLGVLARVSAVIDKIIADPIAFLGNLVAAIKQGLNQFVGNILTHLKTGLMGWLFGTLAEAGIQLPEHFDLKGILGLVLQLLGLTYANLRARAVGVLGEKAVAAMEKTVDIFKTLATEGIAGIWKFIVDKLTTLKDTLVSQVQDFVITKIITAGVTWLVSMLNPASAFVRACKMIYDVVMFFIERGSQIMSLVNAVIDGAGAIASGAIGGAANLVEQALAKALPLAISFLASLLGLGGIAEKIKSVIKAIQAPVNKAIDTVVNGAVSLFKKLGGDKLIKAVEKGITWGRDKIEKGKKWVKEKAKGAKEWVKGKFYGGTEEEKQKRLQEGVAAGVKAIDSEKGDSVPGAIAKARLAGLRLKHRLPVLEAVAKDGRWAVHGEIQRMTMTTGKNVPAQAGGQAHAEERPASLAPLAEGAEFYFKRAVSMYKPTSGPAFSQNVGRVISVFRQDEKLQKGSPWWVRYRPRGNYGTMIFFAPATEEDGTTPAFVPTKQGKVHTRVTPVPGPGGRAFIVEAIPLDAKPDYSAPGSASPLGWDRIAATDKWTRSHLVNGSLGGGNENWNLVPTPASINSDMKYAYELHMHEALEVPDTYFFFRAEVEYHSNSSSRSIGQASDFASGITVYYDYAMPVPPENTQFERMPGALRKFHFSVRLPRLDELKPDRVYK